MKVILDKVGVLEHVEYELADLNILCGENNTGKTYITYLLYGFLDFWKKTTNILPLYSPDLATRHQTDAIDEIGIYDQINKLMKTGSCAIPLDINQEIIDKIINAMCSRYSKHEIINVLAGNTEYIKGSKFKIEVSLGEIVLLDSYEKKWHSPDGNILFQVRKESGNNEISLTVASSVEVSLRKVVMFDVMEAINIAYKEIVFSKIFPDIFIASAERTGAVIFKDELDINRNELFKVISDDKLDRKKIFDIISNQSRRYPLPVERNLRFIRDINHTSKDKGKIATDHQKLLNTFDEIIGGKYNISDNGIHYVPKGHRSVKLTISESSSSVRALLDISCYLRYLAKPGDILMIDEPELNLHPTNQRKLARLFATLVNLGLKIFITTHSDYIVKEINTLIMLYSMNNKESRATILEEYGYINEELIDPNRIKVYVCKKSRKTVNKGYQLLAAKIDDKRGIIADSFDSVINQMNKIQEKIIFED